MMTAFSALASALFLLLSLQKQQGVNAFPTGAGACPRGKPAVAGSHLTAETVVNGTLADGRIELEVDENRMTPQRTVFLKVNKSTPLWIRAPYSGKGIKGFLIRLGHSATSTSDADVTQALSIPPSDLADNPQILIEGEENVLTKVETAFCFAEGASGITHTSTDAKYIVKGNVMLEEPASDLVLDVTVVLSNSEGKSEYYYSQYQVQVVEDVQQSSEDGGTSFVTFGESSSLSVFQSKTWIASAMAAGLAALL